MPPRRLKLNNPTSFPEPAPVPVIHVPVHGGTSYHHRSYYLGLTIVGILGIFAGLVISIDKFKTDEEIIALSQDFTKKVDTFNVENWQEHENIFFGINFRYPSDAVIYDDNQNVISIRNLKNLGESTEGVEVFIEKKPPVKGNFNLEKWLKENYPLSDSIPPFEETSVAGHTAYFLADDLGELETPEDTYIVPTNNGTYLIGFTNLSFTNDSFNKNQDTVDKIISTIKFTNSETSSLIKACPESWYENRMPGIRAEDVPSEYYIYRGERREVNEFDGKWVKANCNLEKQVVY
jgi:hypothetical protein